MANAAPTFSVAPPDPATDAIDPELAEAQASHSDSIAIEVSSSELIRQHYRMQCGGFITESHEEAGGMVIYSEVSSTPMWNHAAWLGSGADGIENFLEWSRRYQEQRGCRPVVYCVPASDHGGSTTQFLEAGYEKLDVEAWMVFSRPAALTDVTSGTERIVQARTDSELCDFVEVFKAAFQARDSAFGDALKRQARETPVASVTRHFVSYDGDRAVCITTLIKMGEDACIYNVGTLPGARNRGHAAVLVAHVVRQALANRCPRLFLQVTAGGAAERLYRRLGFEVAFRREGYRLKAWPPQLSDGAVHRRHTISSQGRDSFLAYFRRESAASGLTTETRRAESMLPREIISVWKAAARNSGVSPETVLMAAWACLLSRYSNEETVNYGVRTASGAESPANLVYPCKITVPVDQSGGEWLQAIETLRTALIAHKGDASIPKGADAASDRSGEFESVLDFQGHADKADAAQPIIQLVRDDGDRLRISYDPSALADEVIQRISSHLTCLLRELSGGLDRPVGSFEILPASEREQLLVHFNRSEQRLQRARNICELIEAQSKKSPDSLAVIFAGDQTSEPLSYAELNRRANQLAHYLRSIGAGPDTFVGLCFDRSLEMLVALLAIMKAGGAVVPLDPSLPNERLVYMIADARMPIVLTEQRLAETFQKCAVKLVCCDAIRSEINCQSAENPSIQGTSESIAYVIYTSGSTGMPKGVLIPGSALAQHCVDISRYYELSRDDRVLQFASISFDAAFEQIFTAWVSGACLVLRGAEIWTPKEFADRLASLQLTVVDLPTAYWHRLAQEWAEHPEVISANQLRLLIVGGEAMVPETLQIWRATPLRDVRVINAYGPTEATITATTSDVGSLSTERTCAGRIPIGRPLGGRKVYILDRFKRPVPLGVAGELYIGGELLARGYLNRPELTKERFVPDSFSHESGARLYRTGDLVRYLPDGQIEFLGRLDDQVKIRGFRIELGEIETVLSEHSAVKEAAVVLRNSADGSKQVIAYIASRHAPGPTAKELRYFLKQKLPDYMVPSRFVMVDALPLTVSGKVDRQALPSPIETVEEEAAPLKGPSEPLELRLQLIFEKVLNRRPIGVDVSFFELGGDSLQALELIVGIERAIGKSIPLEALYQSSTVEALARFLGSEDNHSEWSSLVPLQTGGVRPPFFLIHTTPGDILGYGNLIHHLGPDQPCYGFQSLGLGRSEWSHHRIEEMAAHYVELLRAFQPQGPYYLGGWCYGGIVAVEMAHQLWSAGETIALLALLETVAPPPSWSVLPYHAHRFGCVLRMKPRRWMRYLREKIKYCTQTKLLGRNRFQHLQNPGSSNAQGEVEKLTRLQHVYAANLRALKRYRSKPYPGRVTLFNAAELDPALIPDREYGWVGLAAEIEIHSVPGNHDSMLTEPHVSTLADDIRACLRRAQNASRNSNSPQL